MRLRGTGWELERWPPPPHPVNRDHSDGPDSWARVSIFTNRSARHVVIRIVIAGPAAGLIAAAVLVGMRNRHGLVVLVRHGLEARRPPCISPGLAPAKPVQQRPGPIARSPTPLLTTPATFDPSPTTHAPLVQSER